MHIPCTHSSFPFWSSPTCPHRALLSSPPPPASAWMHTHLSQYHEILHTHQQLSPPRSLRYHLTQLHALSIVNTPQTELSQLPYVSCLARPPASQRFIVRPYHAGWKPWGFLCLAFFLCQHKYSIENCLSCLQASIQSLWSLWIINPLLFEGFERKWLEKFTALSQGTPCDYLCVCVYIAAPSCTDQLQKPVTSGSRQPGQRQMADSCDLILSDLFVFISLY